MPSLSENNKQSYKKLNEKATVKENKTFQCLRQRDSKNTS